MMPRQLCSYALQNFDFNKIDVAVVQKFLGNFCYLFLSSTFLRVFVSSFLTCIYKLFS
jgi:hypothetical protein